MKIGLLGFTFANANKGCEALTYSFLYTVQKFSKNVEICYYSYSDDFGAVKKYFPSMAFSNYKLSRKKILTDLKSSFDSCDLVFDISFGDGFADIYNPKGVFWNTLIKQIANKSKAKLVLLPQTYGPFNSKLLEMQAADAIKHAELVLSRDALSSEYVKRISGVHPETVTDLAFSLPYSEPQKNDDGILRVGLNVSGLLWKGGFYKENQFGLTVDYQKYIESLIKELTVRPNIEVHLIPHVNETIQGSNDGDLFVNDLLADKYPNLIKAPAFDDPIETKNYIAKMDVVTAARMHATVDSFSAGVPVVPFAYSRKFEGLYGSLGYDYIVDGCRETTEAAVAKTLAFIERREEMKASISHCKARIDERNLVYYQAMAQIMNHICSEV